jgi:hypothetical protein
LRVDHSRALQQAASDHKDALADALAQIQALAHSNVDALNQQKLAHAQEMDKAARIHRQAQDSILQKLADSESEAQQSADFHSAELAARDQAHGETVRGLKGEIQAVRAERDSLLTSLRSAQQDLERVQTQARASEAVHRRQLEEAEESHREELSAREGSHREAVQNLEAELEALAAEKDRALGSKSSEYCQQLAAVAIDHQKAVDSFHTQIRSSESRSQQIQVGCHVFSLSGLQPHLKPTLGKGDS